MRNNSFLVECVIGIVSVQQSSPLIKRSFPDSRSMSGSSTWTMVQPSMSGMGDDWYRSMGQLNSKAFSWLTAASLQATVLLGGAALAPSAVAQSKAALPVTKTELLTYSSMSVVTFCEARSLDVEFVKAVRVSIAAEVFTVFQKHGGKAAELKTPLDEKQFIASSQFRLVGNALRACPKFVPAEQKKKFDTMLEQLKKNNQ